MSMHGRLISTGFAAADTRCPASLFDNGH